MCNNKVYASHSIFTLARCVVSLQMYPDRDITNIVESSHYYQVPNFCKLGHSKCKASFWVKPFRCLG